MLDYEKKITAKADVISDLQQEMFGYVDVKTRKKVPGVLDNIFDSIDFEAYANDPAREMTRINDLATQAMAEYISVMLEVGVITAKLFAENVK